MPHTIIEHSFLIKSDKISELFFLINQNIAKSEGNFDILQCKARSVFVPEFLIANGSESDFMHITIKILQGRSPEIRKNLAEHIIKIIGEFLKENKLSKKQIALSIDISEMEKTVYQKTVI